MYNHAQRLFDTFIKSLSGLIASCDCQLDPEKKERFFDARNGIESQSAYCYQLPYLLAGYYLKDSPYYHDKALLELAAKLLTVFESRMHEDGSVDLVMTNFHDPSETGFLVTYSFPATELLCKFTEHTPLEDALYSQICRILKKLGHAMATLGFHTPNHRWVISAGLSIAYRYTKDESFLAAINGFMKEGIDCDENGEYTERSTGSYNIICNRAFVILAYFLDPSYLEYPRRNLELMKSFIEPDMTVNTLNSSRWDQGGKHTIAPYYPQYLICSLVYDNSEFAAIADSIWDKYGESDTFSIETVLFFMLFPEMIEKQEKLPSVAPAADQTRFLPSSHVARIYKPSHNMTMTVLKSRCPVFFQLNYGHDILQVRYAGAFFGDPHSQFRAQEIVQTADGFRLTADEYAGYRSQLDEAPETSDWRHMDHSKRRTINIQHYATTIDIHILDDGAAFDISTDGCEGILTKLEFVFLPGGKLNTADVAVYPKAGDYLFLKSGTAQYDLDANRYFEIGDGFHAHTYAEKMRGAAPVDPAKVTLCMTAKTPQHSHTEVHVKKLY